MTVVLVVLLVASVLLFNDAISATTKTKSISRKKHGGLTTFHVLVAYEASAPGVQWPLNDANIRDALTSPDADEIFRQRKLRIKYDVEQLKHGLPLPGFSMKAFTKYTSQDLLVYYEKKKEFLMEMLRKHHYDSLQLITAKSRPGQLEARIRKFAYGTPCSNRSIGLVVNPQSQNALLDGMFHNLICTLAIRKKSKCYSGLEEMHLRNLDNEVKNYKGQTMAHSGIRGHLMKYLSKSSTVSHWNFAELCRKNKAMELKWSGEKTHHSVQDSGMGISQILSIIAGVVLVTETVCGVVFYFWKKEHDRRKLLKNRISIEVKNEESLKESLMKQYSIIDDPNVNFDLH